MFAKHLLKESSWRVGEKEYGRCREGGRCVCVSAVADGYALKTTYFETMSLAVHGCPIAL